MPFDLLNIEDLPEADKLLIRAAQSVMERAYNPYSGFHVGSAAITIRGKIYLGTFMENASYGLTICAEPAALMAANTAGDLNIVAMAIVGGHPSQMPEGVITPCGRCRQIIYEAAQVNGQDIGLLCCNRDASRIMKTSIYELLPVPFTGRPLSFGDQRQHTGNESAVAAAVQSV